MRKPSVFLSILLFAALLLAACGAEETNVPGTDVPPITAEVTPTEDTSGTATESPTEEGTMTETPGVPVTGGVNPARLSNQLDFDVWNQNGEQIGEVNDIVLDLDNNRVSYVIVGTGGFLEIGEKDVFVPWDSLELQTGAGDVTGGDENAFIYQGDQEVFNNAPDVDVDATLPERGAPAGNWDLDIRNYWESGGTVSTPAEEETAIPNATAGEAQQGTAEATGEAVATDPAVVQAQDLQGVALASDVLGSSITVSQGMGEGQATVDPNMTVDPNATPDANATAATDPGVLPDNIEATIDDMIVAVDTGQIQYLVVDVTLDEGQRWIPVPLSFIQWDAANGEFVINANPATFRDAPFFENGQYPDTTMSGWNSEFDTFWQNNAGGS